MTLNNVRDDILTKERRAQEDFSDLIFDKSYTVIAPLNCEAYISKEPLPFENRFDGDKMQLEIGGKWAKDVFDCAWFHITGKADDNADTVIINCGGEGLVCGKNGEEIQGITCYAASFGGDLGPSTKRIVPIRPEMCENGNFDFWIDCGANDLFGNMKNGSRMAELYSAKLNEETRNLAFDIQALLSAMDFGDDPDFSKKISDTIDSILDEEISEENAPNLRKILAPLLAEASKNDFTYYAVGHAHLDLAWLWPIRETHRKGARTFATQIMNIKRYPDYVFGASQAQLYTWIKDEYPRIFEEVKRLAKDGRWDVQGATWVEPDSNLIGGESLIRQFFYGKRFYRDEFGMDMKIFWVPDSFGYSACIPQVMKLADVPYFLTQKMSWNTYNKFPHHSFYWEGLDGSTVLTHMLPENTYNAPVRGDYMKNGENRYAQRSISDKSMSLFGIGDGGAGPGFEHIERAMRFKNLRSLPKYKMCESMDFFKDFDDGKTPYPTHRGELYLEKHQGTYTTRSDNKKYNRKCEFALRNYELTATKAAAKGITPPISSEELEKIWKEILLYQFHDILPGSSINRVYEESVPRYKTILNRLVNSTNDMLSRLTSGKTAVNLNSFPIDTKIQLDEKWYDVKIPAFGITEIKDETTDFAAKCSYDSMENDKIRVRFKNGFVSSVFDKTLNREFIPENALAGVVSMYDDLGDCWDMTSAKPEYIQTKRDAECTWFKIRTDGAKAYADCRYTLGDSDVSVYYYILDGDNAVYCDVTIKMRNTESMIRMAVPVSVNTEEASFNIQFGHIKRRTTENTPEELAQFEVSGQKFVDMSEEDCGFSLINDSKYGFRCKNGVIDINLLRSPVNPGTEVDLGHHEIHLAFFTHDGKLGSQTYQKAYSVNNPIIITDGVGKENSAVLGFNSTNENIILETVKIPEDGNGIIARFYNCTDENQQGEITIAGYRCAETVNILEEKIADRENCSLNLHGFELINIRFIKED